MLRRMKWPFPIERHAAFSAGIVFDEERRRHLLSVTDGDAVSRFVVNLHVCPNPCCACWTVELVYARDCEDATEPEMERSVLALDVRERQVAEHALDAREHDPAFAKAVADGMSDEGWALLVSHLYGTKREQMRSMDLDALEVHFPPPVMDGDGSMTGYAEIFPFAEWFPFATDEGEWVVDDQYCVSPMCKCRDVALTFFPSLPNRAREDALVDQGEMPAVHYDYRRGSFEVLVEPTIAAPPFSELVSALRKAHPDIGTTLKERHRQLRYLFGRVNRERHPELQAKQDSAGKIGRNDPCPCGSGKKYKRCCGG